MNAARFSMMMRSVGVLVVFAPLSEMDFSQNA